MTIEAERLDDRARPYTTGEVASICHVTINAVKKWIAADKLKAFRTPGGHFRVNKEDFVEFLGKYKLSVKEEAFPDVRKILVVDDEVSIVEFVRGAIEVMQSGFVVESVNDGYEALIRIGDFKPQLLVLDIRMPKIDGFDVCRRIKGDSNTNSIKILAITAYGKEDMDKILDCGADFCMPKPLKLKEFQKNVQRLLR